MSVSERQALGDGEAPAVVCPRPGHVALRNPHVGHLSVGSCQIPFEASIAWIFRHKSITDGVALAKGIKRLGPIVLRHQPGANRLVGSRQVVLMVGAAAILAR